MSKVYLHTFPPLPHVYSMSPFSIKVESWLRLHGIDYECVHCMEFGPKGQIPFVLIGDEVHTCTPQAHCKLGLGLGLGLGFAQVQATRLQMNLDCAVYALCTHYR